MPWGRRRNGGSGCRRGGGGAAGLRRPWRSHWSAVEAPELGAASVRGVAPVHRGGTEVGGGAPDAGVEAAAAASRDGATTLKLGEALELRQALQTRAWRWWRRSRSRRGFV